jgi:hypothetical protein
MLMFMYRNIIQQHIKQQFNGISSSGKDIPKTYIRI